MHRRHGMRRRDGFEESEEGRNSHVAFKTEVKELTVTPASHTLTIITFLYLQRMCSDPQSFYNRRLTRLGVP